MTELGDCYAASGRFITECDDNWRLCHGIVIGTGGGVEGVEYGHAWIESDDGQIVLDVANGSTNLLRSEDYYRAGSVKDVVRYGRMEAITLMVKHGHFGPWHDLPGQKADVPVRPSRRWALTSGRPCSILLVWQSRQPQAASGQ